MCIKVVDTRRGGHRRGANARAIGGAIVIRSDVTAAFGNKAFISVIGTARKSELREFLTKKSYQSMRPFGFATLVISASALIRVSESRMLLKTVAWKTISKLRAG